MAQAESQIVGYVTKEMAAGKMDIMGVSFQNIGDTSINVQDIIPVSGFGEGVDLIRVWNPTEKTYTFAYYYSETYADYNYEPDLGAGWADGDQIRSNISIDAGQGFWLTTVQAASMTIAGEVLVATDNKVSTLAGKMDLICNTFPVETSIQDITLVSGFGEGVDLIRVWNPTGKTYTFAYYYSETYANYDYEPDLGAGWADGDQIRVNAQIPAGSGFWLTTVSDVVVEFVVPAGI